MAKNLITTGVDQLVQLLRERKRISLAEAAKQLAVPRELVEEWTDFLEERGLVKLEYKFTTPYLVYTKPTAETVRKTEKSFQNKREAFQRQVESTLRVIQQHAAGLLDVKQHLDRLNAEIEEKVKHIREELQALERFDTLKKDLRKELIQEYEAQRKKLDQLTQRMEQTDKQLAEKLKEVHGAYARLDKAMEDLEEIQSFERKMKGTINDLRRELERLEKRRREDERVIQEEQKRIGLLRKTIQRLESQLQAYRNQLRPLMAEYARMQKDWEKAKNDLLARIEERLKRISTHQSEAKRARERLEEYVKRKVEIDVLMDALTSEAEKLRGELLLLKQEAALLKTMKKNVSLDDLEKRYEHVLTLKEKFEKKLEKLRSIISKSA